MENLATLPRHRLTVEDYHRMGEAGILTEDDRVELIEGELIEMPPIGSRHAYTVDRLNRILVKQVSNERLVRVQNPILMGKYAEPEPDIAIVRNRHYAEAHPGPEDVLLLIEVADTTLVYDREVKVPLYARHGVPEVWLVDLGSERVEIYLEPTAQGYRQILRPQNAETTVPSQVPEVALRIADLWG